MSLTDVAGTVVQTAETAEYVVKMNAGSVEAFANIIQIKKDKLGKDFKDEYKDLYTDISVHTNITNAFFSELSSRNILKMMSEREVARIKDIEEVFVTTDEKLADYFNIGITNGKTFLNRINSFGITKEELEDALCKIKKN